jgi:hypothetical protein
VLYAELDAAGFDMYRPDGWVPLNLEFFSSRDQASVVEDCVAIRRGQ